MLVVLNDIPGVGPNQLLWDLGVDNVHSEGEVRRKIAEMDEKFHLVMILEHFEVGEILTSRLFSYNIFATSKGVPDSDEESIVLDF